MLTKYRDSLIEAVNERRKTQLPPLRLICIGTIIGTLVYIVLALILVPSDEPREYHFVYENGAATALSAILLSASSAFSLATMVTLVRRNEAHAWVWLVLALGFGFLSFDELLQFHERVGRLVGRFGDSGMFRKWDDVIVILYGFIALPLLAVLLPGLLRSRMALEMFAVGFTFYALHTLIDSITEPPTTLSIILEESAKLMCGTFLAMGTFVGFVGAVWNSMASTPVVDDAKL